MGVLFTILLVVFLVWILTPVFKVWMAIRRARRQARDFFSGNPSSGPFGPPGNQRQESTPPRRHRKIIDKNVGEYVDFEEVSVASETTTASDGSTTQTTSCSDVKIESQVEDAEWEEV